MMSKVSFGQAFVAVLFVTFGVMAIYGMWDMFHYEKIKVEPGIHEVAVSDFMHGRAWESSIGGRVGIYEIEEGLYWVCVDQRGTCKTAHPTVKGEVVLATESRDEALQCVEGLVQKLSEGRRFMKTATACYFIKPIRRSDFAGTEYNFHRLQSS